MRAFMRLGTTTVRKRAVVAVQVAVLMVVLLGFAVLTVDVGALYNNKADLQRTADAAALAAAARLVDYSDGEDPVTVARETALDYTVRNPVFGNNVSIDTGSDVVFGRATYSNSTGQYTFTETEVAPDAVRVRVRKTADSENGAVTLFFARIFGHESTNMSAEALAAAMPRDIAVVADLSASHTDDSEFRNYQLTNINMFEVWDDLPGGDDDVSACDNVTCASGQVCSGGACVAAGPGNTAGPSWGYMDNLGWGTANISTTYNPTTDTGLVRLQYNSNWSVSALNTYMQSRGYNTAERNALNSSANDSSGGYANRVAVALGLANWNSGIPGGRWSTVGAPAGNNNTMVGSNEMSWQVGILGASASSSSGIWLDYIDNYVRQTGNEMYSANSNFRYRYGIKTFMNYLLEKRVSNTQTPALANTRTQPMQAVKDAVSYMTTTIADLDTDDQISLEIYGTTARHEVNLTKDHHLVSDRLNAMQAGHYDSWTNTGGGIMKGIQELTSTRARGTARKVIILLTDGNANVDSSGNTNTESGGNAYALAQANAAAAQGIRIFAVSVGADSNTDLMQQIADITNGEHFHAEGSIEEYSAELAEIFGRLAGRRPVELIQ